MGICCSYINVKDDNHIENLSENISFALKENDEKQLPDKRIKEKNINNISDEDKYNNLKVLTNKDELKFKEKDIEEKEIVNQINFEELKINSVKLSKNESNLNDNKEIIEKNNNRDNIIKDEENKNKINNDNKIKAELGIINKKKLNEFHKSNTISDENLRIVNLKKKNKTSENRKSIDLSNNKLNNSFSKKSSELNTFGDFSIQRKSLLKNCDSPKKNSRVKFVNYNGDKNIRNKSSFSRR